MKIMQKKQITFENIFLAIKYNTNLDPNALKPLTLLPLGQNKNTGLGRLLFIYFANKAGYGHLAIQQYLGLTPNEYWGKHKRINNLLVLGRSLFENDPNGPEYPELFFYRKFTLVKNYLRVNHRFVILDEVLY